MSGTQSTTLTDRTPNILNKDPVDRKPKNDKCSVSLKHEFDPTGLVQRCVIIQRDENGFGLTVSGDNPVFVQLVKEDGAAMRAGVQTGDRIIKVNGTLVTHSNHIEVVKLIKSGSYVALTVLGRPPGLPQLPLEEEEEEERDEEEVERGGGGERRGDDEEEQDGEGEREDDDGGEVAPPAPREGSPAPTPQRENKATHSQKLVTLQKMLMKEQQEIQAKEEELGRNPRPKLLKELQEAKRQVALLQEQLAKAASSQDDEAKGDAGGGGGGSEAFWNNNSCSSNACGGGGVGGGGVLDSPDTSCRRLGPQSCSSPDTEDAADADCSAQCIVGSPPYLLNLQIIGAEDDYFDSQQEQISGQCSCFQSIELLKCRPAHLAVFLHHVVSQFDPTPLLCFLYADMHKQSSSKESRRFFMEFHSLFIDRSANLKVPVPDTITAELDKRRLELIPEELCKQLTQQLQEALLPDLHRNLDDFRHKRSMGLTLAEDELSKLESEGGKDPQALEKECSCAEHILSKIEDILLTSQPTEEEKCQTMQYVILTYMKHLGVKVKEPRGLEHKRPRINFLPKIKKSIKPEKEGEEKVKKPRFPNILGPPRRLTRVDSTSVGKAVELNKQRSPRQPSQSAQSVSELPDPSSAGGGRTRGSQPSEGSDGAAAVSPFAASPTHGSPSGPASDTSGQESDSNLSPFPPQLRPGEPQPAGEQQDALCSPTLTHFDFSPSNLEQLQEEEQDPFRMEVQCSAELQSEGDRGGEGECEEALPNWQSLVSREVLASMTPGDINRQEVINELFYTERAHLRTLKVLDRVFYQRLNRDAVLPPEDVRSIFTNLEEIIQLHVALMEQMTAIRKRSETSVIGQIGDDLLAWFSGEEEEKIIRAVGTFCSNQPSALELIKTRKKKDQRFTLFMQEAESNRLCRRLQLKDIIPMEMMRVTKYPLLLENIAKYTEDGEERDKVKRAGECCKKILNHVNQAVKEAENKQRLVEYQRRLDISSLKQSENPVILELKNLDLTKRTMVHEGILSWKVSKDKTIELYALLLEDILVLLQKQDERLVLKFHGKSPANALDVKNILSPVIKLNTVLVRPVATDNKSFFVLSMSDNGAQIYELMAQKVSDQRTWQCLITQCAEAMKAKPHGSVSPAVASQAERDAIEIISREMPKAGKDASGSPGANADAAEIPPPPVSLNPFDGMKSDEEEEEEDEASASARGRQREEEEQEALEALEEEVDEAELEAFLDGQLADRLLQEGSRRGVAIGNQELDAFDSKAEDALRTLVMLKKVLFSHMIGKDEDERKEETEETEPSGGGGGATDSPDGPPPASGDDQTQKADAQEAPPEPPGCNGGFVVLDGGGGGGGFDESSTDDDGGGGCDVGIDMSKLLSSSSQAGGGGGSGPALSRQLMTHLRLLQADLQYLKEVETKYNELRQTLGDTPTDSDDNNDGVQ